MDAEVGEQRHLLRLVAQRLKVAAFDLPIRLLPFLPSLSHMAIDPISFFAFASIGGLRQRIVALLSLLT